MARPPPRGPTLFAEIDACSPAIDRSSASALLLPELLGERPGRLEPDQYQTHRGAGAPIIFVKKRLLMPLLRWFYEFSRDKFERQRGSTRCCSRAPGAGDPNEPAASELREKSRATPRQGVKLACRPTLRRGNRRTARRCTAATGRSLASRHASPCSSCARDTPWENAYRPVSVEDGYASPVSRLASRNLNCSRTSATGLRRRRLAAGTKVVVPRKTARSPCAARPPSRARVDYDSGSSGPSVRARLTSPAARRRTRGAVPTRKRSSVDLGAAGFLRPARPVLFLHPKRKARLDACRTRAAPSRSSEWDSSRNTSHPSRDAIDASASRATSCCISAGRSQQGVRDGALDSRNTTDAGGQTSVVLAGPSTLTIPISRHPCARVSRGRRAHALLAHTRALIVLLPRKPQHRPPRGVESALPPGHTRSADQCCSAVFHASRRTIAEAFVGEGTISARVWREARAARVSTYPGARMRG